MRARSPFPLISRHLSPLAQTLQSLHARSHLRSSLAQQLQTLQRISHPTTSDPTTRITRISHLSPNHFRPYNAHLSRPTASDTTTHLSPLPQPLQTLQRASRASLAQPLQTLQHISLSHLSPNQVRPYNAHLSSLAQPTSDPITLISHLSPNPPYNALAQPLQSLQHSPLAQPLQSLQRSPLTSRPTTSVPTTLIELRSRGRSDRGIMPIGCKSQNVHMQRCSRTH